MGWRQLFPCFATSGPSHIDRGLFDETTESSGSTTDGARFIVCPRDLHAASHLFTALLTRMQSTVDLSTATIIRMLMEAMSLGSRMIRSLN